MTGEGKIDIDQFEKDVPTVVSEIRQIASLHEQGYVRIM